MSIVVKELCLHDRQPPVHISLLSTTAVHSSVCVSAALLEQLTSFPEYHAQSLNVKLLFFILRVTALFLDVETSDI